MKIILLSALFLAFSNLTNAQPGTLDSSFGTNGIVTTDLDLNRVTIQGDGKIVVAGSGYLARYNTDGRADSSFDGDGKLETQFYGFISLQFDGKIITTNDSALACYNSDGSLDKSFGKNGFQYNDFTIASIALQKDGKIVVAGGAFVPDDFGGHYNFGLARYNSNGGIDSIFSDDGKQTTEFIGYGEDVPTSTSNYSLAIKSDGTIVMSGRELTFDYFSYGGWIAYYSIDGSYIGAKFVWLGELSYTTFMTIGSKDQIVVTGNISNRSEQSNVLLRFNPTDGSNTIEKFSTPPFGNYKVSIESNGKIITTGPVVARFNANEGLDSTFSNNGILEADGVADVAISKNKLYVVANNKLLRYILENENNTPPTVSLTAPSDKATYLAPVNLQIAATATDADGTISKVEFYNGSTLLYTDSLAPYAFTWKNTPGGNYTLTTKAIDNSGLATISAPVNVTIVPNKAPIVSITNPVNNRTFAAPAYIHFEAAASDDGRITRVEFYNGSTLLTTEYKAPYKYVWKNLPVGIYTVTAVATDNWGAQTMSAPVTVKVKAFNTSIVSSKPNAETNDLNTKIAISLKAWPNPANKTLTVSTNGLQQNKPTTISILSVTGVIMKTIIVNNSAKNIPLDISSLTSGVYTLKIVNGESIMDKQFVKL